MNPATTLARVLVDELVRCGVREAVLCPGSRSAPLAYALERADRQGRLRLHVRVDERSAAFLALGLAKVSRRPAVVVTTSGTAVANLHPAVLEASHADVPMLVMSADRPAELLGTGANQTTVQPGLFGAAVRWSSVIQAPERAPLPVGATGGGRAGGALGQSPAGHEASSWRSTVCRAWAASTGALGGRPGPVHLDVQLREPLVPESAPGAVPGGQGDGSSGDTDRPGIDIPPTTGVSTDAGPGPGVDPVAGRPAGRPWVALPGGPDAATTEPGGWGSGSVPTQRVADHPRTLVVLGDLPEPDQTAAAVQWAATRGWPVVAEPFGAHDRAAVLRGGSLLLTATDWVTAHLPARVVTVGRITLSRHVFALLGRPGVLVEAVTAHPDWTDPSHVVEAVYPWSAVARELSDLPGPPRSTGSSAAGSSAGGSSAGGSPAGGSSTAGSSAAGSTAAGSSLPGRLTSSSFTTVWREAATRLVDELEPAPWPSGLAVAGTLLGALPEDACLFAASSNAARDLDLSGAAGPRGLRVVASRGLAGIDGCVATAVGLALAGATPSYALVGDLAFVHDAGALAIGPGEPRPDLTVVVANDDGGGIFALLEPGDPAGGERIAAFERIFGTPTGTDLAALCRAFGVPHVVADSPDTLAAQVRCAPSGLRVVEVRLDRARHREIHAQRRSSVSEALRRMEEP